MSISKDEPVGKLIVTLETGQTISVSGKQAIKTIKQLFRKGLRGLTAFEMPPAFRLAAYIHKLREIGIDIETKRERHEGSTHARYILRTAIIAFGPV